MTNTSSFQKSTERAALNHVPAAYILTGAMFPEDIDWDELKNHRCCERMYYGAMMEIFLLTAIFLARFYPQTRERQNHIQRSL